MKLLETEEEKSMLTEQLVICFISTSSTVFEMSYLNIELYK